MAQSPTHKFGQIIGDLLEGAISPILRRFATEHDLYLDYKGKRPCRNGVKCIWVDKNGNKHELDYVLESGGTPEHVGDPVAFIEIAWRRYTRHSKNKAQEIQGAIEPLAETYYKSLPFKGAVLAGEFTDGALEQLRSLGFSIVHFPYSSILSAFSQVGIDAFTDETMPDEVVLGKITQWERLSSAKRRTVADDLLESNHTEINAFLTALAETVYRRIDEIVVLPLHGQQFRTTSIEDATNLLNAYDEAVAQTRFERYEIHIRFRNNNKITGTFHDRASAVEFLNTYKESG